MKNRNLKSTLIIFVLMVFVLISPSFAQNEPVKNQEQVKSKVLSEVQNQEQIMTQNKFQSKIFGSRFVDLNGDGINDRPGRKMMNGQIYQNKFGGNKYGPGNGTGNSGIGPKDGTGYGAKYGAGTGNCDGTGPKGKRGGRK